MGRVFKPWYTKTEPSGEKTRVLVKSWYVEFTDETGKQQRIKVGPDKKQAQSALARLQERTVCRKLNLPDPTADALARARPVAELTTEYLTELIHRGRSSTYRREVSRQLAAMAGACVWRVWSDITAPGLLQHLAGLMTGEADASPATANSYLRTAKGFVNWYRNRAQIPGRSPLGELKPFNEEVDQRRSRRVLSDAELKQLIEAARTAPRRHGTVINGPDRAVLYRAAAYTGLRANELASLTPAHFALDADPPLVTVEAKDAKSRRCEPLPIHPELLAFLREWLPTRKPGERLWPGDWAHHRRQAAWIARDAKRAGLGAGVHFHGLKRKFVTGLIRSKVDIDEVRRLARHRHIETTLKHYAGSTLASLAVAVSKLPGLSTPPVSGIGTGASEEVTRAQE